MFNESKSLNDTLFVKFQKRIILLPFCSKNLSKCSAEITFHFIRTEQDTVYKYRTMIGKYAVVST